MTTTMYFAEAYFDGRIQPVQVARASESSVWVQTAHGEVLRRRLCDGGGYFDTEAEARAFLHAHFRREADRYAARAALDLHSAERSKIIASRWSPEPTE